MAAPSDAKGKGKASARKSAPTDERFASAALSGAGPRNVKGKGKAPVRKLVPTDERFASLASDPRFVRTKRSTHKLAVDERFKTVFDADPSAARVDSRGRKVGKDRSRDELRRFYRLDEPEGSGPRPDYARGEGLIESSESEDEDEDDESERGLLSEIESSGAEDDEEIVFGDQREVSVDLDEDELQAVYDDEPTVPDHMQTRRLAAVNLDWDHVRAVDLFKVFTSALSPSMSTAGPSSAAGRVVRVTVYPSDFGRERMAREELSGPPPELFKPVQDDEADSVRYQDGDEYDARALRKYQLERLRYYYAIAEFSSVAAARRVFDEIDGTELEKTANQFSLRSVPDDMTFDEASKRDECTADTMDYKSVDYVTDVRRRPRVTMLILQALRNSRVKLTWDADDPQRSKLTRIDTSKLSREQLDKLDASLYLASSGSSDESGDEDAADDEDADAKRARMRAALGLDALDATAGRKGKDDGGMTITFAPAFADREAGQPAEETTMDAYKRKEKERKKAKKAERAERPAVVDAASSESSDGDDEAGEAEDDAAPVNEPDDLGFDHPFFASDSDADAPAPPPPARADKASLKAQKAAERDAATRQRAELELLVDDDSADDREGDLAPGSRHFDMKTVLKAEKDAAHGGGGKRKKRKGAALDAAEPAAATAPDAFEIDVADERFRGLHEDPDLAIDPSSTSFIKSRNTQKLLDESRKRRERKSAAPVASAASASGGLDALVASVKRKSAAREDQRASSGKSKRRKV